MFSGIITLKSVSTWPQGIHSIKLSCNLDVSTLGDASSNQSTINFYVSLPINTNINTEVEGVDYLNEAQIMDLEAALLAAQNAHTEAIVHIL